ncbi:ribonuclease E/G [Methylopila sp. M107]|uniref:ribonuclease E/G n=1 Tax=Methylopila sp. M107 TaxID=1101190 RepID=UPI00035CB8B4|nr:ribonuclease E/G [Methylopila sp. M107]
MANKMLIDATHAEETRVVVVRGSRVEEFDFESANRKQLRGNIYLAKVTRVEPSLQAAFIEYGGNRHGFLAFSEIHPDYYQIPVADRQALIAEDEKAHAEEEAAAEKPSAGGRRRRGRARPKASPEGDATVSEAADGDGDAEGAEASDSNEETAGAVDEAEAAVAEHVEEQADKADADHDDHGDEEDHPVESIGAGDALEELPERKPRRLRSYKIQEVIKRRQILLVQVVKEERGTKGAALTTYLSLAGRYSVLMPNTARGGGISRKITSAQDRKRLKDMVGDLEVPEGMGVILRTAGASRTKPEIKRDFEYLMRLWETVRDLTLKSTAPALVYEEGSLIKRSIRDLYNKEIDEVLVAGENGYREAKDFMRMLMPSYAKIVQPYRDSHPLYSKMGVETQLDAMFSNIVTMKSGGYIVINQTEALVAIDVNSGRSTREHNIEDTALRTNLEAAEEAARQMRLRDLAGLIVIDFIDMEEGRNNRAVEKKLKDCLKNDRARIQLGRISHFGLMEMSRQRIRTGVLESSSEVCPICSGVGTVRAVPSVALHVLRLVEDGLRKDATRNLLIKTRSEVALYLLNQKRGHIREIEGRFGVILMFAAEEHLPSGQHMIIERTDPASGEVRAVVTQVRVDSIEPEDVEIDEPVEAEAETDVVAEERAEAPEGDSGEVSDDEKREGGGRRRRRRRRRGGRGGEARADQDGSDDDNGTQSEDAEDGADTVDEETTAVVADAAPGAEETPADAAPETAETPDGDEPKTRRRGRRGGRRSRGASKSDDETSSETPSDEDAAVTPVTGADLLAPESEAPIEAALEPAESEQTTVAEVVEATPVAETPVEEEPAVEAAEAEAQAPSAESEAAAEPAPPAPVEEEQPPRPRRTGWWSKRAG